MFENCSMMRRIDFSNNQLTTLPDGLFGNCSGLEVIDFGNNQLKMLHDNLFKRCAKVRSLNLEKNNIEVVSFISLIPLSVCIDINLMDNCLYNSKSLYSLFFQQYFYNQYQYMVDPYYDQYRNSDGKLDSNYFIMRNQNQVEKSFLAFYLSSSSKTFLQLSFIYENYSSLFKSENYSTTEFSLLDLFISVFGEIDDSKIINLKKHIDQLILKDSKMRNIEFLIRSAKTIKSLCTRNVVCHLETFFPNTFNELILRVRKTNTKAVDSKFDEKSAFKSFCKYVAIKRKPNEILFHLIEYTECFNIALKNKNQEMAKFVVILLRYYVMAWSENEPERLVSTYEERKDCRIIAQCVLNKFNRNLFCELEYIFANDLTEIVIFLLDIKKLDQLTPKESEEEFIVYDLDRFNEKSKNLRFLERLKVGQDSTGSGTSKDFIPKEFLQLARDNDDMLKHESVKQIFTEKWRDKAAITYYFDLIWFIVFVISFTIYVESKGKVVWYISLVLVSINLILELLQFLMHIVHRKFHQYITRYVYKFGCFITKVNLGSAIMNQSNYGLPLNSLIY